MADDRKILLQTANCIIRTLHRSKMSTVARAWHSRLAIDLYLKCLSVEKLNADSGKERASTAAKPSTCSLVLPTSLDDLDAGPQQELDRAFRENHSAFGFLSFRDALKLPESTFDDLSYRFEPSRDPSEYPVGLLMAWSHFLQQFGTNLQPKDMIRS